MEKTLESPLNCKEMQPVHSEGDQPWDFFGRNDAKAETPILWPPHAKSWVIGKDSDSGREWGQEEKGRTTEDEMAGWHHWLDGRESEWTLGVGDGQGGLACCDSWGRNESDTTEWLNWTEGMERVGSHLSDGIKIRGSETPILSFPPAVLGGESGQKGVEWACQWKGAWQVSWLTEDHGQPLLYNKKYSVQVKDHHSTAELKSPSCIPLLCNLQENDTWLHTNKKMNIMKKINLFRLGMQKSGF